MKSRYTLVLLVAATLITAAAPAQDADRDRERDRPGTVHSANLVYGNGKTSACFADHFLVDARRLTHVQTADHFTAVRMESAALFDHPFAVMSGEGAFELTDEQASNLGAYLTGGGFLVASSGCSSPEWDASFRAAIARTVPQARFEPLSLDHPVFHAAYEIDRLITKRKDAAKLEGMTIDGRLVLVYASHGLNDTANAGGGCCCCGGNEILNARQLNVNLLIYALTH